MKPGAFKLWVKCIQQLYSPHLVAGRQPQVQGLVEDVGDLYQRHRVLG
jgi:hypothetical protein